MKKRLTSSQVEASVMALAFVRALLIGSNPKHNKLQEANPCPVVIWEDEYQLDNDVIDLAKGENNAHY
jgi:hypothetical protein